MLEWTGVYPKTLPPHIHAPESLAKRYWGQILALLPVVLAACLLDKLELLHILLLSLISAVAFEFLAAKIFQKKEKLRNGETILTAVLLALLMPPACPAELIVLGNFLAIFLFKEALGGTGSYLVHPVLMARIFLQVAFPKAMGEPLFLAGGGAYGLFGAIVLGGLIFLKQKRMDWDTPVLYTSLCTLCAALWNLWGDPRVFLSGIFFTAFFLLADPVVMPLTQKGTRVFVVGAALLSMFLGGRGFSMAAVCYAVLFMNLLTPWLDFWIRPAHCRGNAGSRQRVDLASSETRFL